VLLPADMGDFVVSARRHSVLLRVVTPNASQR
jgi:hypothetical protein